MNALPIIVITGTTGYIGGFIKNFLTLEGFEVLALEKEHLSGQKTLPHFPKNREVVLLHFAAMKDGWPSQVKQTNLRLTAQALNIARNLKVKLFIFASSVTVLRESPTGYSQSKILSEALIKASGIPCLILRLSQVYGKEGKNDLTWLIKLISWMPFLPLPEGGKFKLQPLAIDDLAKAILKFIKGNFMNETFTLTGPQSLSFLAIVKKIEKKLDKQPVLISIPILKFRKILNLVGYLLFSSKISVEKWISLVENKIIKTNDWQRLKIKPTSFDSGLKQLIS